MKSLAVIWGRTPPSISRKRDVLWITCLWNVRVYDVVRVTCEACCRAPVWQLPCLQTNRLSASTVWQTLLSLSDTGAEKKGCIDCSQSWWMNAYCAHTLFLRAPWLNSAKEMREQEGVPASTSSLAPSPSSSLERHVSVRFWKKEWEGESAVLRHVSEKDWVSSDLRQQRHLLIIN